MKIIIYCLLAAYGFCSIKASDVDSLKKVLPGAAGLNRAVILNQIASTYEPMEDKERLEYAKEAYSISMQFNNDTIKAKSLLNMGIAYNYLYKLDSADYYYNSALKMFRFLKDTFRISSCLNNLGVLALHKDNYAMSVNYYMEALKIKEKLKDSLGITKVLNNLGVIYNDWMKLDLAMDYFLKVLDFRFKIKDSTHISQSYRNLGIATFKYGLSKIKKVTFFDFDNIYSPELLKTNDTLNYYVEKSKEYFNLALQYAEKYHSPVDEANAKSELAMIAYTFMNFNESIRIYEEVNRFYKTKDVKYELTRNLINLGMSYYRVKNNRKAMENLKEGTSLAEKLGLNSMLYIAYNGLMKLYGERKDYEKAYYYSCKIMEFNDSVYNTENVRAVEEIQNKFNLERKDAEIALSAEKEKSYYHKNIILIILTIFLLLVLAAVYLGYRYKTKVNKILKNNNAELSWYNKNLEQSGLELKESNDTKDKFFSIIAHDLINPVGAFRSITKLADENYYYLKPEEQMEFLRILKDASSKLLNLLENLLTWSRTQTGKLTFNPETYNLRQITDTALDSILLNADNKKITINNLIPDKIEVFCDLNMISTVFRNLVSNSIKFTETMGEINISARKENGNILVSVRDNGIGMTEEIRESLFRIDKVVKRKGTNNEAGTGLGLIICREFIEKHNGEIRVESEIGKGTEFFFTIPRTDAN